MLAHRSRCLLSPFSRRVYSTVSPESTSEIRDVLQARVKDAMRTKNISASTTLRSILAEINAADKAENKPVPSSNIMTILRKASAQRHDAATQYTQAGRPDLAEKEVAEAFLLEQFLPPLLSTVEIDKNIQDILNSLSHTPSDSDTRKATGKIFKEFYNRVDRSLVDAELVKTRVNLALAEKM
ncbi:Yqey-like protein-domain-containing protein [Lentinula lateritia]|uniref:Yqey-like protein-domain-containing protein n=1 Tax=Lentinula aff. lateritia TaxID=2804960 RepID=A0ACC1TNG8_9AGAR|nr:Yqey-like protein-domain-containing protein [Lentinula aff. lateritia]KAJ3849915.1 Yqey-like protein-domain-containing protein [Lentinula lateritia]